MAIIEVGKEESDWWVYYYTIAIGGRAGRRPQGPAPVAGKGIFCSIFFDEIMDSKTADCAERLPRERKGEGTYSQLAGKHEQCAGCGVHASQVKGG